MALFMNLQVVFTLVVHCFFYVSTAKQAPQNPNQSPSLLLLSNCSAQFPQHSDLGRYYCRVSHATGQDAWYSCLYVDDIKNQGSGSEFELRNALNCSSFQWVNGSSMDDNGHESHEMGMRMSLNIPDHVPNLCDECRKPGGHCGVGLRCICHPKECRDYLISGSESSKIFPFLTSLVLLMVFLLNG